MSSPVCLFLRSPSLKLQIFFFFFYLFPRKVILQEVSPSIVPPEKLSANTLVSDCSRRVIKIIPRKRQREKQFRPAPPTGKGSKSSVGNGEAMDHTAVLLAPTPVRDAGKPREQIGVWKKKERKLKTKAQTTHTVYVYVCTIRNVDYVSRKRSRSP